MFSKIWWTFDISLYNGCVAYVSKLFKSVYVLTCANFADLHWGGFTTQRGDKKRTNGADEKYTVGRILKGISGVIFIL